ncbi:MAG: YihY/virulence factor BrkB family protein [Ktedonobacteraceae bacterium]
MANQSRESKLKQIAYSEPGKAGEKERSLIQQFLKKISNDWVLGFAAGLAFDLLAAIFPIFIALISIFGLFVGRLDANAKNVLINNIQNVFPPPLNHENLLQPALNAINSSVGFLGVIAVLTAIVAGSGLFVSLEGYLDIFYHIPTRNLIQQYIMAILMLLFFLVLIPVMVFGATLPALVLSLLRATSMNAIPGIGLLFSLGGILIGLVVSWVFFVVIYIVVPNQRISFRHSWRGALAAAIAVQVYLILFPLYVTHFFASDSGTAGFAVILLFFFFYFAVILLIGAEVNAFFAQDIRVTPDNIAAMVHDLTSHLPTSEKAMHEQATFSHKDQEPKEILSQSEARKLRRQAQKATNTSGLTTNTNAQNERQSVTIDHNSRKGKTGTILQILTVATVTLLVEFFRERRGK